MRASERQRRLRGRTQLRSVPQRPAWPGNAATDELAVRPLNARSLVLSVLLFFYRRKFQDKQPITFRDKDVPTVPDAQEMALLHAEETVVPG